MEKHAILLNSGGVDSRVAAKISKDEGYVLHSLFIHANFHNDTKTIPAAKKTAELYCVDHYEFEYPIDLWMEKKVIMNEKEIKWWGIPYTGWMAYIIGAQYAMFKGYPTIISGMKNEGRKVVEYVEKLADFMTNPTEIIAPVFKMSSKEVIELAKREKIPLKDTWSCNRFPACERCTACKKRKDI